MSLSAWSFLRPFVHIPFITDRFDFKRSASMFMVDKIVVIALKCCTRRVQSVARYRGGQLTMRTVAGCRGGQLTNELQEG